VCSRILNYRQRRCVCTVSIFQPLCVGASISLETWSSPSPSLSPLPLSSPSPLPPSLPSLPSFSLPLPLSSVSLPSFPNSHPSLSLSPPLIQLGGLRSAVSSPSGVRGGPRPLTRFVYFKLGNDGRCQRCSVIVICRKMFQTKAH